MISRTRIGLRAALVALAALGWWAGANAQPMTPANTLIENRATVNYSVGSQPQTLIESSPTGNTTPGTGSGADTEFLVDNRVDFTVTEVSSNATVTTPGAPNAVLAFTVLNTGNAQEGYALTFLEEVGTTLFSNADNANFGNLVIRVDEDPSNGNGTGNDTYDGTETATAIDRLNPNQQVTVFIVSPAVPLTLVNANFANVSLTARVAVPGTSGATLLTQSTGVNDPAVVEIIFADDPLPAIADATESAVDQFAVQSAALSVTKAQSVISDGFSSSNPRAIPDAIVEYTITIANGSTTTAANGIAITDPIPANTTFVSNAYPPGDVGITGGSAPTCIAESPTDSNSDGCLRDAGGNLVVGGAALGTIAAGATISVQFRVQIN